VVGAEYSLETGEVDFFDGVPAAGWTLGPSGPAEQRARVAGPWRKMVRAGRRRRALERCGPQVSAQHRQHPLEFLASLLQGVAATGRSRRTSRARYTTPMPPRPSSRSRVYWPASSACSGARASVGMAETHLREPDQRPVAGKMPATIRGVCISTIQVSTSGFHQIPLEAL